MEGCKNVRLRRAIEKCDLASVRLLLAPYIPLADSPSTSASALPSGLALSQIRNTDAANGYTSLTYACLVGAEYIVQELLKIGHENAQYSLDELLQTPIHLMVSQAPYNLPANRLPTDSNSSSPASAQILGRAHSKAQSAFTFFPQTVYTSRQDATAGDSGDNGSENRHQHQSGVRRDLDEKLAACLKIYADEYDLLEWPNLYGQTALHVACQHASLSLVRLLLDLNASVQVRDHQGLTPLHVAAQWARPDVVDLLLERGADPTLKDAFGLRPADIAGDWSVHQLLQKHTLHIQQQQQQYHAQKMNRRQGTSLHTASPPISSSSAFRPPQAPKSSRTTRSQSVTSQYPHSAPRSHDLGYLSPPPTHAVDIRPNLHGSHSTQTLSRAYQRDNQGALPSPDSASLASSKYASPSMVEVGKGHTFASPPQAQSVSSNPIKRGFRALRLGSNAEEEKERIRRFRSGSAGSVT